MGEESTGDWQEGAGNTQHTVEFDSLKGAGERRRRGRTSVVALTVLYHPDLARVGDRVLLPGLDGGRVARLSRNEPAFAPPGGGSGSPLADPYLSRSPLLLTKNANGGLRLVAEGSRTAVTVDGREVTAEVDLPPAAIDRGVVLQLAGRIVLLVHRAAEDLARAGSSACASFGMVGASEAMVRACGEIRRVADLQVPVLVRGPTGSGKELAAQAIHQASERRGKPFVSVNLAAVPASLAASELFGAVKGAFTGAVRPQPGFFQRADGGTLFLDEVGEAPVEVQAALLRVLETGEVQRVGSQAPLSVDVRLVAATDRDLESAAEEGEFRGQLLHRVAGYEITLPELRERRDDFGRLLVHFLREELEKIGEGRRLAPRDPMEQPWLPSSIVARLARHDWPGNVRQLRNVARQLAVAGRGEDEIRVTPNVERLLREAEGLEPMPAPGAADTGPEARGRVAPADPGGEEGAAGPAAPPPPRRPAVDEDDREYRSPADVGEDELVATLRAHHWEVKPAAEALGVSRPSLYNLIERSSRVHKAADLSDEELAAAHRRHGGDLDAMVRDLEVSRAALRQRLRDLPDLE